MDTRKLTEVTRVNEKSPYMDTPSRMKQPLFDYQKAVAQSIIKLAETPYVKTNRPNNFKYVDNGYPMVALTSACRLTDPFGSGKSITVLAVLAHSKTPRPIISMANSILDVSRVENTSRYGNKKTIDTSFNTLKINSEYKIKYSKVINPSIIVVGSQVLHQWLNTINDFTDFKTFVIENIFSLRQFYTMFRNGTINHYDVILIKNGMVTGDFRTDDSPSEVKTTPTPMLTYVSQIMRYCACPWLVYDDFDTIRIPDNVTSIHGLFTIYVSTSNKQCERIETGTYRSCKTPMTFKEMVETVITPPIVGAASDYMMSTCFNMRSFTSFIESSTNLPIIKFNKCMYVNESEQYLELLSLMGNANAELVREGVNADALTTVAKHVGIDTDPRPSSIFQRILENDYTKWEFDCNMLVAIAQFQDWYDEASRKFDLHPRGGYLQETLDRVVNTLTTAATSWKNVKRNKEIAPERFNMITYRDDNIPKFAEGLETDYEISMNATGKSIENVKSNLEKKCCQICRNALHDIVIAKCCSAVICGACLKNGFRLHRSNKTIVGKCPNCMKSINMSKDLIYITRGIDIDSILDADAGDEESSEESVESEEAVADTDDTKNPKLKALYNIICRKEPENMTPSEYRVKNLLSGVRDIPEPADIPKKVLVFAGYNETLTLISGYIEIKKSIKCFRLGGTASEIFAMIEEFRNYKEDSVLLINSNEMCAGMNIQFATDLVFFHKMIDDNIEAQVAGRAQRVGRKFNLNLYYLLYTNEGTNM